MNAPPLRILVAEDNDDLRDLLVTLISAEPDLECVGTANDVDSVLARTSEQQADVLVLDLELRGSATSSCIRSCRDREQRLAGVLDQFSGEDGVIVQDTAVIVLAWNIGRQRDGNHAGRRTNCTQVQRTNLSMRNRAQAERRVQRIRRQRDIVAIQSLSGDVQMRTLVAMRFTCGCAHAQLATGVNVCSDSVVSPWLSR